MPRRSGALLALASVASLGVLATPATARGDGVLERFALHGEGGAGTMFPSHQRSQLGYSQFHFHGTGRLAVTLFDPVAFQVSGGNWYFLSDQGNGSVIAVTAGLRVEPEVATWGRLFIDGNAGLAITGGLQRFGFDAGIGFQFGIARAFWIGPVLRYAHVVQDATAPAPQDAQYWAGGLAVTLRAPPPPRARRTAVVRADDPPPPPPDTDRDGVVDPADQCVTEPQGDHPDPARLGCPLRDSDNDTVFDNLDQCPTTPRGDHPDPERAGCPDGDDDNDTVLNHDDQCRTEHQGPFPDAARPGCPLPDRDRDSIPDPTDHCPDQPGAPHPDPNRNGCPGLVQIEGGQIRILRPVFFATNRDTILPRSFPVLQAVADGLTVVTAIRRVSIEGHTDDVGDDARNQDLSQRRANSVMAWLVAHGVAADRLEAHGFGETRPVVQVAAGTRGRALNAARAQNRRVEFRIVDPANAPAAAAQP